MSNVTVYGAAYSVYVRSVRLALEQKRVQYDLEEVDIFADEGAPHDHLARQPFGKIPAFRHGDFQLYENGAIIRYVDRAFQGDPLTPRDPACAARMDQIISILDNYGYRSMVWGVFVERVRTPAEGGDPNERTIQDGLKMADRCLRAISDLSGEGPWLAGRAVSLADLHAIPMITYFALAPEGREMLDADRKWSEWRRMVERLPATEATKSPLETL